MLPFNFEEFFGPIEQEKNDTGNSFQCFPIIRDDDSIFVLTEKQKNSLDLTARIDWDIIGVKQRYTIAPCENKYNKKIFKRITGRGLYDGYYDRGKITEDFYSNFKNRIKRFSFSFFLEDLFSCIGKVSPKWKDIFSDKMFFDTVKSFICEEGINKLGRIAVDDSIISPICFRVDCGGKIDLDLKDGYGDVYVKRTKEKSEKVYLCLQDFIRIMFINDIVLGNRAKELLPIKAVKEVFGEYSSFFGLDSPSTVVLDAIDWLIVLSLLRWNCYAELMSFIFVEKDYRIARACMLSKILEEYDKAEETPYIWLYPSETSPIFVKCK